MDVKVNASENNIIRPKVLNDYISIAKSNCPYYFLRSFLAPFFILGAVLFALGTLEGRRDEITP
jgi:hypothetical protein